MKAEIHPTALVDRHAELADDVVVGPWCQVQAGVRIGPRTRLLAHVVIAGNTTLGAGNVVHPFAVLGGDAQLRHATDKRGALEIGDDNVFRENVTVSVSAASRATRIGSHNLFMAGSHVGHDVTVGSQCVVANAVQLAGHVTVDDWVTFGGLAGVAQHLFVGQGAFVAAGAMCERDVPPFVIVQGDRARVRALNTVGLERRGVPAASIAKLRTAYAALWGPGGSFDARATLDAGDPWVAILAAWLADPMRTTRPAKRKEI